MSFLGRVEVGDCAGLAERTWVSAKIGRGSAAGCDDPFAPGAQSVA